MGVEGVRGALLNRPFEPFNIRMADGRSLAVRHPEMVAVGKRRIVVVQPGDSTLFIEPLLIVSQQRLTGLTRGVIIERI